MSKFDVVLIAVGLIVVSACVADFWLITHDYPEFGAGFWSVILGAATGEVVTFSIYKMVKRKSEAKLPNALAVKHPLIQAAVEEEENGNN